MQTRYQDIQSTPKKVASLYTKNARMQTPRYACESETRSFLAVTTIEAGQQLCL
jgi:hypothetical protein